MLNRSKFTIRKALGLEFSVLERMLFEFENVSEMHKWFDWSHEPRLGAEIEHDLVGAPLGRDHSMAEPHAETQGEPAIARLRFLRDASVVCGVVANRGAANALEIGSGLSDGDCNAESVFDETRKALSNAKPGDYILWHEFNLALAGRHRDIYEVCLGLEQLYCSGLLQGNIYHLCDSWVGLYRVPS